MEIISLNGRNRDPLGWAHSGYVCVTYIHMKNTVFISVYSQSAVATPGYEQKPTAGGKDDAGDMYPI